MSTWQDVFPVLEKASRGMKIGLDYNDVVETFRTFTSIEIRHFCDFLGQLCCMWCASTSAEMSKKKRITVNPVEGGPSWTPSLNWGFPVDENCRRQFNLWSSSYFGGKKGAYQQEHAWSRIHDFKSIPLLQLKNLCRIGIPPDLRALVWMHCLQISQVDSVQSLLGE